MENEITEIKPATPSEDVLLEWMTPEFIPIPRTKKWYMAAGVIVISLIAYAIFTGSATMAIVFVLLAGMFFMTHKKEPRIFKVQITKLGIQYGPDFYSYHTINSFWIVYHPPYVRSLYLRLGGKTFRYIKIELNQQSPVDLRNALSREVPELEGMEERPIDLFTRLLRLQ